MEENQINVSQSDAQQNPVINSGVGLGGEKMSKKSIIGMTILTVVALAGVAFGIWGMSEKDRAERDLAIKITEMSGKVTDITADKITSIDEDGTVTEITDTNVTADVVNPADYIYVGEWGLKIKIPEDLEIVTYAYDIDNGYTVLRVSGATKDGQSIPDYAMIDNCRLGGVERYSKANVEAGIVPDWYGDSFMSDDDYNYYYNGPQALCTENQNYAQGEVNAAAIIKSMLSDSKNYSKF